MKTYDWYEIFKPSKFIYVLTGTNILGWKCQNNDSWNLDTYI